MRALDIAVAAGRIISCDPNLRTHRWERLDEARSLIQVILSRAADLTADLIVMGAYGHSRLRELVLGGVSRSFLQEMTVPVLMSH